MPEATVREASAGDAPALAELRWAWHLEEGGEPQGREAFLAAFAGWTRAVAATHRAFLAHDPDGQAVGMAWLAAVERPPGPGDLRRRGGDLQSVFVLPAQRGTGLGAHLVEAVVDAATRAGMAHLTVRTGSRPRPFYRHLNFVEPDQVLIRNLSGRHVDPDSPRSTHR